ncbi:hypothetical protein MCEMIEM12_00349 [Burkholderiaceae bacterium]
MSNSVKISLSLITSLDGLNKLKNIINTRTKEIDFESIIALPQEIKIFSTKNQIKWKHDNWGSIHGYLVSFESKIHNDQRVTLIVFEFSSGLPLPIIEKLIHIASSSQALIKIEEIDRQVTLIRYVGSIGFNRCFYKIKNPDYGNETNDLTTNFYNCDISDDFINDIVIDNDLERLCELVQFNPGEFYLTETS